MSKRKTPARPDAPKSVLRDLGAATTETKRFGPPERIDGLWPKSKGPYFG